MIHLALCGGSGAMGKVLQEKIRESDLFDLVGVLSPRKGNLGEDLSPDLIVDFSRPDNLDFLLDYASQKQSHLMICTTGLEEKQLEKLRKNGQQIPILLSSNTSIGIYAMRQLIGMAATILEDFDIQIQETHHRYKLDAPSGTAKTLREDLQKVCMTKEMPIHSRRIGTIPGEHQVIFAGEDEVLEIRHYALSKKLFAVGALRLAERFIQQGIGYYETQDMMK